MVEMLLSKLKFVEVVLLTKLKKVKDKNFNSANNLHMAMKLEPELERLISKGSGTGIMS